VSSPRRRTTSMRSPSCSRSTTPRTPATTRS
jgi:hypothetical protein